MWMKILGQGQKSGRNLNESKYRHTKYAIFQKLAIIGRDEIIRLYHGTVFTIYKCTC